MPGAGLARVGNSFPAHGNLPMTTLKRELGERHVRLIALGACIGVGLFLGSAKAIEMAGPAIVLAYLAGGLAILVIMRALGELAVHNPVSGSFSRYAHDYLGPLAGFLTGWNYWFALLVICVAEISAVAIYMGIWFPEQPRWLWALAALGCMGAINLLAVRAFGEFEFWFALIKVVTIVALILGGIGIIAFGLGNDGVALGLGNLWQHGGFLPNGLGGVLMSLQLVMFAYFGTELVGLAAGETRQPQRTIPRAIGSLFWRLLLFYVGALLVILAIYPWHGIGSAGSPFVLTFERLGIRTAAGLINFVVISAALSACNVAIFSTGRMLCALAEKGQAPALFARTTRAGVPRNALLLSLAVLLLGVLGNYLVPEKVFLWATAIVTFGAIWTWAMILLAQLRFRAGLNPTERQRLHYPMWLWPWSSYLALAFLGLVLGVMGYFGDLRVALYVGPAFLLGLAVLYYALGVTRRVTPLLPAPPGSAACSSPATAPAPSSAPPRSLR